MPGNSVRCCSIETRNGRGFCNRASGRVLRLSLICPGRSARPKTSFRSGVLCQRVVRVHDARCRPPALHAHRCACAEPVSARWVRPPVCSATEQTGGSQTPLRDCRASRLTSTQAGSSPRARSRRCRSSMSRSRRRSRCTHVGFGRPSQPRTRACRFHAERHALSLHIGPATSPDHVLQLGVGFGPPAGCPGLNVGERCCRARDDVRHGCFACAARDAVSGLRAACRRVFPSTQVRARTRASITRPAPLHRSETAPRSARC